MNRRHALRLTVATLGLAAVLPACGGDDEGGAATPAATPDTAAIEAALATWGTDAASTYSPFSPPMWVTADSNVLMFAADGTDPVAMCQDLNDFLTADLGTGFDTLNIKVVKDLSTPAPLASSAAGAACTAG